jgi:hypothetical protein
MQASKPPKYTCICSIAKKYTDVRGLTEGTAAGIFLITALQLIAGMFQGKLGLECLLAQFLSSL